MPDVMTTQGKDAAVKALEERRKANKGKPRINNSSLHAGSPMYFYCIGCGGEIVVPESYTSKPDCCRECEAMKKLGWLT